MCIVVMLVCVLYIRSILSISPNSPKLHTQRDLGTGGEYSTMPNDEFISPEFSDDANDEFSDDANDELSDDLRSQCTYPA